MMKNFPYFTKISLKLGWKYKKQLRIYYAFVIFLILSLSFLSGYGLISEALIVDDYKSTNQDLILSVQNYDTSFEQNLDLIRSIPDFEYESWDYKSIVTYDNGVTFNVGSIIFENMIILSDDLFYNFFPEINRNELIVIGDNNSGIGNGSLVEDEAVIGNYRVNYINESTYFLNLLDFPSEQYNVNFLDQTLARRLVAHSSFMTTFNELFSYNFLHFFEFSRFPISTISQELERLGQAENNLQVYFEEPTRLQTLSFYVISPLKDALELHLEELNQIPFLTIIGLISLIPMYYIHRHLFGRLVVTLREELGNFQMKGMNTDQTNRIVSILSIYLPSIFLVLLYSILATILLIFKMISLNAIFLHIVIPLMIFLIYNLQLRYEHLSGNLVNISDENYKLIYLQIGFLLCLVLFLLSLIIHQYWLFGISTVIVTTLSIFMLWQRSLKQISIDSKNTKFSKISFDSILLKYSNLQIRKIMRLILLIYILIAVILISNPSTFLASSSSGDNDQLHEPNAIILSPNPIEFQQTELDYFKTVNFNMYNSQMNDESNSTDEFNYFVIKLDFIKLVDNFLLKNSYFGASVELVKQFIEEGGTIVSPEIQNIFNEINFSSNMSINFDGYNHTINPTEFITLPKFPIIDFFIFNQYRHDLVDNLFFDDQKGYIILHETRYSASNNSLNGIITSADAKELFIIENFERQSNTFRVFYDQNQKNGLLIENQRFILELTNLFYYIFAHIFILVLLNSEILNFTNVKELLIKRGFTPSKIKTETKKIKWTFSSLFLVSIFLICFISLLVNLDRISIIMVSYLIIPVVIWIGNSLYFYYE